MEYIILTFVFCLSVGTVCAQRTGELNDRCRTIAECRNFGYLCGRNRTCQCLQPLYIPNESRDKCVGTVDQTCKYDEHCVDGAYCFEQTECKCKDFYTPTEDGMCSMSNILKPHSLLLPYLILSWKLLL